MHFDTDLNEDVRKARERFIEDRERQLQSITTDSVAKSLTFLFTVNAGSAIALLAYMGAISAKPDTVEFKVSLTMFFIGVLLIGIFNFYVTENYGSIFRKYKKSVIEYFQENIEWEYFLKEINSQVKKKDNIPRIFVYASFLCFLLGSVFVVFGLMCN